MTNINEELLDEDPESLAVEADEDIQYEPDTDSNVVAVEPKIISVGRGKRKDALRNLSQEQR
mgnify:CR=1 FL=1